MKKLLVIAASLAASFSVNANDLYSSEYANEIKNYSQDQLLLITKNMNEQVAKDMPIKIDMVTTITAMYFMSSSRSLNYNVEIDLNKYDVRVNDAKLALNENKKEVANNLCNIYSTRTMMEGGFVVNYRYVSTVNKYITSLRITKKDCK